MSKLDDIRVLEEYDKKSEKNTDCLICTKKKEWFDRAQSSISLSIPAAAWWRRRRGTGRHIYA